MKLRINNFPHFPIPTYFEKSYSKCVTTIIPDFSNIRHFQEQLKNKIIYYNNNGVKYEFFITDKKNKDYITNFIENNVDYFEEINYDDKNKVAELLSCAGYLFLEEDNIYYFMVNKIYHNHYEIMYEYENIKCI